ncbi:MAG: hypothetical protein K5650_02300 [Bacteroidales bacterium]|nr:hypothetical protein [Bacteroidales bacterium]
MNENIINKLNDGVQRLRAMADRIANTDGKMPVIERDIMLQELRELYTTILGLECTETVFDEQVSPTQQEFVADNQEDSHKEESKPLFAPEEDNESEPTISEPILEQIENNGNEKLFESDDLMVFEVENDEQEKTESEEQEKPSDTMPEPKASVSSEPEEEQQEKASLTAHHSAPSSQPSLFDYLGTTESSEQPTVRTLGETLYTNAQNLSEQLERRAMQNKVSDLRTIININDKFSFMSELFHNNMKAYNDFILRLNAIDSRETAMEHVQDIARQYNWDNNSMVVMNFYKIFDRKF